MMILRMPDAERTLRAKWFAPTVKVVPYSGIRVARYIATSVLSVTTGCMRVSGPGIVKTVMMRPIIRVLISVR